MVSVKVAPRDIRAALIVRDHMENRFNHTGLASVRTFAKNLEVGYRFFIKYDGGKNLSKAFDNEMQDLCKRLEIDVFELGCAVNSISAYCVKHEVLDENGEWKFADRLDAASIDLADLVKLSREEHCVLYPANPVALIMIDELVRFQAVQKDLKAYSFALQFEGKPLDAIAVDRPVMISRMRRAGFTVDLLEGALSMVKDQSLAPNIVNGVVSVESLMQALGD